MKHQTLISIVILLATAAMLLAQEKRPQQSTRPGGAPPPTGAAPAGAKTQGSGGQQRPLSPIVEALDANKNRTIDAAEIANASAALKKLDKNNDGKLTAEEFAGQRPGGQGGPGGQGQRPKN